MADSTSLPSNTGKLLNWHALDANTAASSLATNITQGLRTDVAERRLQEYGPNLLKTIKQVPWYAIFARQFVNVLIIILLVAAAIAFAIGDIGDAATILAIVLLNGILGFVQEWKAEKAMAALQQMLSPRCRVIRDNIEQEIEARSLVPGDLVVLDTGDRVPGDLRLVEVLNLKVDESALTGESIAVSKDTTPVNPESPLAIRTSMAWMGTAVTNGRARGVVVGTGMATEFGRIAELTQSIEEETTPLQRKLAVLGKQLGIAAVAISLLVVLIGWLLGKPVAEMFFMGVALAVAVVPEGLPAVVTITLALGIQAMVRRRALIRRLQAAEALGAATTICTDKTGTLTQEEMTVTRIWTARGEVQLTGVGYAPTGQFLMDGKPIDPAGRPDLLALLESGLSCNHARIFRDEAGWHARGDPTEAALVAAADKASLHMDAEASSVSEFSFNSIRKRMTVVFQRPEGVIAYVKGAPEVILARGTRIFDGETDRALTDADRKAFNEAYIRMAERGLRTLALAHRKLPNGISILNEETVEAHLTLLGIVGIIDPPRPEVAEAIRIAHAAGIQVRMITGDAAATALAVAQQIGLKAESTVTGQELSVMDDDALLTLLNKDVVFARTTPEHKLRIVNLLQQMGHVVAMTGDGVNDAPALKKADIGIAMGIRGTEVARGASDMVLTDDNFASIIGAIEEGRRQYDNIQKFVRYLLSSNTGEVVAILSNIILGGPLILLPVQILWMNLITDGMTAVALGVEPPEKGIMQRRPRAPQAPILDRAGIALVLILGGYIGLATLWVFHHYLRDGIPEQVMLAQTVAFTGIIMLEKMNVFNFRALREPMAIIGFFSNPWLLLAWMVNIGLQLLAVYTPFLQKMLHTVPLGWHEWGLILLIATPVFVVTETYKWLRWRSYRNNRVRA